MIPQKSKIDTRKVVVATNHHIETKLSLTENFPYRLKCAWFSHKIFYHTAIVTIFSANLVHKFTNFFHVCCMGWTFPLELSMVWPSLGSQYIESVSHESSTWSSFSPYRPENATPTIDPKGRTSVGSINSFFSPITASRAGDECDSWQWHHSHSPVSEDLLFAE